MKKFDILSLDISKNNNDISNINDKEYFLLNSILKIEKNNKIYKNIYEKTKKFILKKINNDFVFYKLLFKIEKYINNDKNNEKYKILLKNTIYKNQIYNFILSLYEIII